MMKIVLPCLLASGLVVGCAPSQATSDVVAAAAVSSAPVPVAPLPGSGSIDGAYKGRATQLNRSGRCADFRNPTIRVNDSTIDQRFGNNRLQATVQPDGTFSARAGRLRMSGTVRDGHLDAQASNGNCRYHYDFNLS